MLNIQDHAHVTDVAVGGERDDDAAVVWHREEPLAAALLFQAVCAALLPGIDAVLQHDPVDTCAYLDEWRIQEMGRGNRRARVSIARPLDMHVPSISSIAPACCIADLSYEASSGEQRRPGRVGTAPSGGDWLLTYIHDVRYDVEWDVYCAPGGATWRMMPRYSPHWLRERERAVMARLRGALPLPDDDPVTAATQGVPLSLDRLHATLQEQERERATVTYVECASGVGQLPPWYVVKMRWRKLSLRPYRSLGFWLVDGITRLRDRRPVL